MSYISHSMAIKHDTLQAAWVVLKPDTPLAVIDRLVREVGLDYDCEQNAILICEARWLKKCTNE